MLKNETKSQEVTLFCGILDGYLLYENKIVLFDYKTGAAMMPSLNS